MPVDNDFNARADAAMRQWKAENGLPPTPVPDGPSPQAPPPGSYAASIREQRQAAMGQSPPTMGRNTVEVENGQADETGEPVNPNPPDAQEAPDVGPDGRHVPFEKHPIYDRFAQVAREKTQYKRDLEMTKAERAKEAEQSAAMKRRLDELEAQNRQLMEQQFESMPPEERAAILARSEVNRGLQQIEERITQKFQPAFQRVDEERAYREIERVAHRYPAFDFEKHMPLIEVFREANPACSVEHAFKAIAEDHELQSANGRPARRTPPPVVVPGRPTTSKMDVQPPAEKEEQGLVEGARRVREAAESQDPMVRSDAMNVAARSIRDRHARRWGGGSR